MGLELCEVFPPIDDCTLVGMIEAVNTVEKTGLARTVGSDDGQYFPLSYLKIHTAKGLQSTESEGKISDFYNFLRIFLVHRRTPSLLSILGLGYQ